jgi:hypothetical protein
LKPKSLSASALQVAQLCMSRYEAEHIIRAARVENDSASLGTACHGAIELYVKYIKFDHPGTKQDWSLLEMFYHKSFRDVFGSFETSDPRFKDGFQMLQKWFNRTDLSETNVISCEKKTTFEVKTSAGPIPFNYIWDRFDQIDEHEYKVVDYKTSKWDVTPDDLRSKIQARVYGLAAQIQHPDAARIWVEFDMLRHDRVSVVFTKQDNKETWFFIQNLVEQILKENNPKETLNDECRFCVKRVGCKAVASNKNVGGMTTLDYMENAEIVDLRADVDFQIKALLQNKQTIDDHLLSRARRDQLLAMSGVQADASVKVSRRRSVDADRVRLIVGDEKFNQYGGVELTIGQFDALMKDGSIPAEKKAELKSLVYYNTGQPYVSTKKKAAFDV